MARVQVSISFETNDDPSPDDLAALIGGWGLPEGAQVNAGVLPPPIGLIGTVTADGGVEAMPMPLLQPPEPEPEPEP